MKRPVTPIGPEHYRMVVQCLNFDQLLNLQEKLLDDEHYFETLFGETGKDVWTQCWDIVEEQILVRNTQ